MMNAEKEKHVLNSNFADEIPPLVPLIVSSKKPAITNATMGIFMQ